METQRLLTVSDVARRLRIAPRRISDAMYGRKIPEFGAMVSGRRVFDADELPAMELAMQRAGMIKRGAPHAN
jgi:hypothetical protein